MTFLETALLQLMNWGWPSIKVNIVSFITWAKRVVPAVVLLVVKFA